jgi:hypothetical protein
MKRKAQAFRPLLPVVAVVSLLMLSSCVTFNLVSQRTAGVDATAGASASEGADAAPDAPAPAAPAY